MSLITLSAPHKALLRTQKTPARNPERQRQSQPTSHTRVYRDALFIDCTPWGNGNKPFFPGGIYIDYLYSPLLGNFLCDGTVFIYDFAGRSGIKLKIRICRQKDYADTFILHPLGDFLQIASIFILFDAFAPIIHPKAYDGNVIVFS